MGLYKGAGAAFKSRDHSKQKSFSRQRVGFVDRIVELAAD